MTRTGGICIVSWSPCRFSASSRVFEVSCIWIRAWKLRTCMNVKQSVKKYSTFSENRSAPYSPCSVSDTNCLVRVSNISIQAWIFSDLRNLRCSTQNVQNFRKFGMDRTRLWSRHFDLSLASFESSICGRIEILKFPRTIYRQIYSSLRLLHRNLRIGARPKCIASGKPSTRFPLGWHVQKGSIYLIECLVVLVWHLYICRMHMWYVSWW